MSLQILVSNYSHNKIIIHIEKDCSLSIYRHSRWEKVEIYINQLIGKIGEFIYVLLYLNFDLEIIKRTVFQKYRNKKSLNNS